MGDIKVGGKKIEWRNYRDLRKVGENIFRSNLESKKRVEKWERKRFWAREEEILGEREDLCYNFRIN